MRSSRLCSGGLCASLGSTTNSLPCRAMPPRVMPWQAFSAALTAGLRSSSACSKHSFWIPTYTVQQMRQYGFWAGIQKELAALQGPRK